MIKPQTLGVIFVAIWGVMTASKDVITGSLLQGTDPFAFAFIYTTITWLYFMIPQLHKLRMIFRKVRKDWQLILYINIVILLIWGSSFIGLSFIQPAIAGAITICISPLSAVFITKVFSKNYGATKSEAGSAFVIFSGLVVVVWSTIAGQSGIGELDIQSAVLGIAATTLCGASMSVHVLLAKRLYDRGWHPTELIAARQPLAIVIMGAVAIVHGIDVAGSIDLLPTLLVLTLFGAALPIYCVQKGLTLMRPIPLAILLTLLPVYTLALESFDERLSTSYTAITGVIVIVLGVMLPKLRCNLGRKLGFVLK